ncbi:MAG: MBL fold metallo-hydrolase [Treponemataceae bacterium]
MRVRFWGVSGSIPTPLTPHEIQNRVVAIVQRIKKEDIESDVAREKFIASLPDWLFTTVGGNTSCLEVQTSDGTRIIFDAGSGLRGLGNDLIKRADYKTNRTYHLAISHFHWDHIQGLPFFAPAYDPENKIIVYSTRKQCKDFLEGQMHQPYFPVQMFDERGLRAQFEFHTITNDEPIIKIGNAELAWHRVRHPGGAVSYSVSDYTSSDEGSTNFERIPAKTNSVQLKTKPMKKFIYSTDTELRQKDLEHNETNNRFYSNTDLMVVDSQYTLKDGIEKGGWGHSTFSMAVDFAIKWKIKKILLFHHEPTYNDKTIFGIKKSAEDYRNYQGYSFPEIDLAQEGMDILL